MAPGPPGSHAYVIEACILAVKFAITNVTWPGKTDLIYTKYTCLYYGMYLLFCMCYP